ncbi:uncharacterized protein SAMN04488505_1065 [Chitinophaga rupis]|jgi:uncharacterized protein|uniref:HD domain-containing protein n=1 Tax=Chitinophaga rupis TaxID=573321 RepID=A0A1H8AV33_9BACT|nr:HD domain-containing protein [Chitinophaga rupis]SEM73668.1 uncharacterized protein SAMN04488505_1065 [Chitinophaga rupis]
MIETTLSTQLINPTVTYVKKELTHAEGGHDWWHVQRVWQLARHIGSKENVDMLVVELGALLHDIADSKFHNGDETVGPEKARAFLQSIDAPESVTKHVVSIIQNISFKGGNHRPDFCSPELAVVQDADRLDALGAIGIARTFNYGGFKNRPMYDPSVTPNMTMTKEQYKQSLAPTINHFYEKLLLLKDRMNTNTAKEMAEERHRFMEQFLEQFYREWDVDVA